MRNWIGSVLLAFLFSAASQGQAVRTWVSGNGVDNALCDRTNPCRSFGAAITAVEAGGEVVVLDSAGYGPVIIDKSVSLISPPGIFAAIAPTAGSAIRISASLSGGVIVIRGLTLNGRGADFGFSFAEVAVPATNVVYIEECWISGFFNEGISLGRRGSYFIRNTTVRESQVGIRFFGEPSNFFGELDGTHLERNIVGLAVNAGKVSIRNSVAARNGDGFTVGAFSEESAPELIIENSQAVHNGRGVFAISHSRLLVFWSNISSNDGGLFLAPGSSGRLGTNIITRNLTGINNAGDFQTGGDNVLEMNTTAFNGNPLNPFTTF